MLSELDKRVSFLPSLVLELGPSRSDLLLRIL